MSDRPHDWITTAAEQIRSRWFTWEQEAREIAQNEQSTVAGECHLLECIENCLRWAKVNHEGRQLADREAAQARTDDEMPDMHEVEMSDKRSIARAARVHKMAQRIIADKLRQVMNSGVFVEVSAVANAILAELAAHDPPLLVCTNDEMKE